MEATFRRMGRARKGSRCVRISLRVGALSSALSTGSVAYPDPAEVTNGRHGDRYWRAAGRTEYRARV
ncbi:hypothetical protein G3N64_28615 [Burkholderia sp. Ac-20344]|nr:hypothetical protein [Burkholderia sp. Ac-20344]